MTTSNKYLLPIIVATIFLVVIAGLVLYRHSNDSFEDDPPRSVKVTDSLVDITGKQLLEMDAKGGYSPAILKANAGQPAVLRIKTQNTIDCSAFFLIKELGIRKELPINGTTDIEIPAQTAGKTIKGWCVMAMYQFRIDFQ